MCTVVFFSPEALLKRKGTHTAMVHEGYICRVEWTVAHLILADLIEHQR